MGSSMTRRWIAWSFAAGLAAASPSGASDGDWNRFRGPNGAGISDCASFPVEWRPENLLWKTPPLGPGISSPSVWGGRFVVTSSNPDGTVRRVECRTVADGGLVWNYETPFDANPKHGKNSYATATAACDERGAVAVFGSSTRFLVLALDWAGRKRWEVDLGPYESRHGCGASPILVGDWVVVPKEADGPSEVVAVTRAAGEIAWRTPRDGALAAYATPALNRTADGVEILVSSTAGLAGLDPRTGRIRWREACFPDRCVGSVVLGGGLAVASCGGGGKGRRLVALRVGSGAPGEVSHAGDAADANAPLASRLVWDQTRTVPYCPTPIAVGDYLFFVTDQGIARCLKLATGEEVWTERVLSNTSASPVCVGGRIYLIAEDGACVVLAASPELKILARNAIEDQVLSTPAMAGQRMIVRGGEFLWCFGPRSD
jgi:outer membrane protein assembly factor BamB